MKFFLILFTFFFISCEAAEPISKKKTICLNMIVKNESQVIEKCLASVKPLIDYWVIVDTGSSDNTQEIVKNCMKGIPGQLYERPWVNFAHNRNEALALAKNKGDYVLLIDADEVLQYSEDFSLPSLEKDLYLILVRQIGAADVRRNGLINNNINWKWEGVIHEFLSSIEAKSSEVLNGVVNLCNTHAGGVSGRSKQSECAKYLRDAEMLENALKEEPNNSRYTYYLGISYAAAEKYEFAKKSFEKRLTMPSSDVQETFFAFYNLGCIQEKMNDLDAALETFFKAYAFRPSRAEPLIECAKIYRTKGNVLLGYLLAKHALSHPCPADDLCVGYAAYDHTMLIEFANCALLLGKYEEGFNACCQLLKNPNLPPEYKDQVQSNYELAKRHLGLTQPSSISNL
jgi:glycosyltransferase involved in cell wall biosynthesis